MRTTALSILVIVLSSSSGYAEENDRFDGIEAQGVASLVDALWYEIARPGGSVELAASELELPTKGLSLNT